MNGQSNSSLYSSPAERWITFDGIRTFVLDVGSGNCLILIHGLGGPQMWQKIVEPLSRHFRVIVIHLPGFGKSECPPSDYSTEQHADAVDTVMNELRIERAIVAGISFGG